MSTVSKSEVIDIHPPGTDMLLLTIILLLIVIFGLGLYINRLLRERKASGEMLFTDMSVKKLNEKMLRLYAEV